ncbi:hypothetical protein CEXT_330401 [Caerostris extrusa]|uniref:Uncharacterized protein n=1 Tax=Caerostris extrusa TaxID=172846 RepID=A0AAV4XEF5_CAEEX|nr:hypothetical protein CEXT_330401 [Caerostris extrusa]
MFVFALLACVAVAQASFLPSYPVAAPLVSNVAYGVVSPAVFPLRSGFSNGYSSYDQRYNVYPSFGYRGVLGYNGLLGGYNGLLGGYNGVLGGFNNGLYYGLRK